MVSDLVDESAQPHPAGRCRSQHASHSEGSVANSADHAMLSLNHARKSWRFPQRPEAISATVGTQQGGRRCRNGVDLTE